MEKQIFDRTKKILGILLLVLFVMSITVTAVSAVTDTSNFGPVSKQNYDKGYKDGSAAGSTPGYDGGKKLGDEACKNGRPMLESLGALLFLPVEPKSSAAYDQGYADGYNEGWRLAFVTGFKEGYNDCVKKRSIISKYL